MKITRSNVFETNSSSVHTVCFHSNSDVITTILPRSDDGKAIIELCEFGWSGSCSNANEKLSYLILMIESTDVHGDSRLWDDTVSARRIAINAIKKTEAFQRLEEILVKYSAGFYTGIEIDPHTSGYIDHQSTEFNSFDDFLSSAGLDSDFEIYKFIFNSSYIEIDNDNH